MLMYRIPKWLIVNRNLLLKLLKAENSKSLVSMVGLFYCSISWQETGLRTEEASLCPLTMAWIFFSQRSLIFMLLQ